jgi:hypothetical protein
VLTGDALMWARAEQLKLGAETDVSVVDLPAMKFYRAMTPDRTGGPSVGRSARQLGIRIEGKVDVVPDDEGLVHPGRGGMSVAPKSPWNVPAHRRPRRLGGGSTGHDVDRIFSIEGSHVEKAELTARIDRPDESHALVEPRTVEPLQLYENRINSTHPDWSRDES